MTSPISSNLIHFTGKHLPAQSKEAYLAHLKTIVTKGIRFNNPDEILVISPDLIWPYLEDIVCFTDVPLNASQEMTQLYGKLGFGFNRETIQRYGGNPVFYVPNGFVTKSKILEALYPMLELQGQALELLANFKMYGESTAEYCYLKEREWRLIYDDNPELKGVFQVIGGETRDYPRPTYKILFKNHDYEVIFEERDSQSVFAIKNLATGKVKPLIISRRGKHEVRYFRFQPEDLAVLILPDFPNFKEEIIAEPVIKDFFGSKVPDLYYIEELEVRTCR